MHHKNISVMASVIFLLISVLPIYAQMPVYQPLRLWPDRLSAFSSWELARQIRTAQFDQPISLANRPQLAGLRPHNLELLQDKLRRASTRTWRTDAELRQKMVQYMAHQPGRNKLKGFMAEAMFADRNPDEFYVKSANASQHDFTQPHPGGGRINTQVKFHEDGNPASYAKDMAKDWRATKFAVPDDHVAALKGYLSEKYYHLKAAGNLPEASRVAKNIGRVRGIRATSTEITAGVRESVRHAAREQYAAYTSFGAALALSLGPTMWDWATGNIAANQAMYRASRSLSMIGVAVGSDTLLRLVREGALRGTLRGNVIVGTAVSAIEITWLLYEHGWRQAFQQASFYEAVGGTLGGVALAFVGGSIGAAGGPVGAVIGSVIGGTVGYFGGRSATYVVLDIVKPELLQATEHQQLQDARHRISGTITNTQAWPGR